MTNQHPITPPLELVWEWTSLANEEEGDEVWSSIATQAARWGADQELQSCCEWFQEFYKTESWVKHDLKRFRAARRPKLPTLKEQALRILVENGTTLDGRIELEPGDIPIIRRALEALPND